MEPGLVRILHWVITVVAPLSIGLRATAAAVVGVNTKSCFKLFNTDLNLDNDQEWNDSR